MLHRQRALDTWHLGHSEVSQLGSRSGPLAIRIGQPRPFELVTHEPPTSPDPSAPRLPRHMMFGGLTSLWKIFGRRPCLQRSDAEALPRTKSRCDVLRIASEHQERKPSGHISCV